MLLKVVDLLFIIALLLAKLIWYVMTLLFSNLLESRGSINLGFRHLQSLYSHNEQDIDELQWDTTAYNVGMRGVV